MNPRRFDTLQKRGLLLASSACLVALSIGAVVGYGAAAHEIRGVRMAAFAGDIQFTRAAAFTHLTVLRLLQDGDTEHAEKVTGAVAVASLTQLAHSTRYSEYHPGLSPFCDEDLPQRFDAGPLPLQAAIDRGGRPFQEEMAVLRTYCATRGKLARNS